MARSTSSRASNWSRAGTSATSASARITQIAQPGDRILVVYGNGHAYLLRHCLSGMPGYRIREANGHLPN